MVRLVPFFVLFEHRIQDGQQLAHTGNQRYFFWLFQLQADAYKKS